MNESDLKTLASQLSCPQGDNGIDLGNKMNDLNRFITSRAIEALSPQFSEVIAEVGPGNGSLSEILLDSLGDGGKYYGIELSEVMAEEAKQRLSGKACDIEIICSDCMHANIPEDTLDGIMAINLLYFIEDLDEFFSQITSWMKPGSRAVFGVRSEHSLKSLPFIQYGFNVRSADEIKECMRNNGFTDVESTYHDEGIVMLGDLSLPLDTVIIKGKM